MLDTETKGTGAEMVPLEKVQRRSPGRGARPVRAPEPRPRRAPEPAPRGPRRFRIVDVRSGRTLAEDADARAAVDLLKGFRSLVDVRAYVWDAGGEDWRPLTLAEQKSLRELRTAASSSFR